MEVNLTDIGLKECIKGLLDEFKLRDIIDELTDNVDVYNILDLIPSYDMDNYIEGYTTYGEDKYNDGWNEGYQKAIDDINKVEAEQENTFKSMSPDEAHCYLCDFLGVTYSDKQSFNKAIGELKEKLTQSTY